MVGLRKKDKPMDAIGTKDFLAITGYTHAILEMDEWIRDKPYFYLIKDHYLVDEAIRVEYIIIQ
mgnify:CR=1 FL=1